MLAGCETCSYNMFEVFAVPGNSVVEGTVLFLLLFSSFSLILKPIAPDIPKCPVQDVSY